MLMNTNIKRIVGGGYEVKEIKYMGSTIWKKPLDMIVTNIKNEEYFDKDGEYYRLKPDLCNENTYMYICFTQEDKAVYNAKECIDVNPEEASIAEMFNFFPYAKVDKLSVGRIRTRYILEGEELFNISYYKFKPLIADNAANTIILLNTKESMEGVKSEEYWVKIGHIYGSIKD